MKSPIPAHLFDASIGSVDDAVSLPPECYTSPEFYQFEQEVLWGRDWFCIGRATDIPKAGDFYTVTVDKDPLMVVRGADGEVHVRSALCRHRAMPLVEGRGNSRRFRCPYHSWVYGLDGALQSAPDLNDHPSFDKSEVRLPEVRSEVWEGFVFITFDPDIPPVAERLGHLAEQLAPYKIADLRSAEPQEFDEYAWNWKIFADECYHCAHLHAKTWNPMYPTPSERIDYDTPLNNVDNGIIAYEIIGRAPGASPTRTGEVLLPVLPGLDEEQQSRLLYVTVMPNLLIIALPDKVKYFLWLPTGPTGSVFAATWLYPQSTLDLPDFKEIWQMEKDDLAEVMVEDVFAWTGVQRGMHSRFAPRGRYAPSEAVLVRFNQWLAERYRSGERV
ncbi:aromatic ring-hydroxylating oxygenase subunit alpha [Streptomyces arenae]|uniref:aromatic ring-hydroxylating oxygenase subunit alpha n=1 Tax=Streptomyces arenae TaxID=29301 RepID=UPI00265A073F|nr:aromatic ring-hydroxylating dioxygenase subunit alpha [Streptomyces arenae]MCG7205099.1 aromatic ring-hydroxylating dioxygenase subunit alpha [Streptomyces arenae]